MTITTINPATGDNIQTYTTWNEEQIDSTLAQVQEAQSAWQKEPIKLRSELIIQLAQALGDSRAELATLITTEMGKPIKQALACVDKCIQLCEHYASMGSQYLDTTPLELSQNTQGTTAHCPLGTIFAIMPWNFPLWQVMRCAVPNTIAGNAIALKHAPISTGLALRIEQLFLEAGYPENIFRTLLIETEQAEYVINHQKIAAVTITGSERAGRIVAAQAGAALKPCVCELGGNDPYLILSDADLDVAVSACIQSRMNNCGQVCIAAKRIIVVKSNLDGAQSKLEKALSAYQFGDPMDSDTTLGPMARDDLREELHRQVTASIASGAKCVLGGKMPSGHGFFYPPTMLVNVKPGQCAFDEELFGPVLAVIAADNDEHAIELANQSPYGLSCAIFSQDIERAQKIAASQMNFGSCAINGMVRSDPRLPFGGTKHSGFGRELAEPGITSFTNLKSIVTHSSQ